MGFAGLFLTGQFAGANVILTAVMSFVANIGVGFWLGLSVIMMADVVDYGEFKFGTRNESLYFSIQPLAVKFAIAIAGMVVGMGLTVVGYQANAEAQSTSTIIGLQVLMFTLPMLIAAISCVIYRKFYKLNGEFHDEVLDTLDARHAVTSAAEAVAAEAAATKSVPAV
jgi:melibiose permease